MLAMRPGCECCDVDLPADSDRAYVCTFECTFCRECAEHKLGMTCPNCGGELVRRPRRPAAKLETYPASTERVHKPGGCTGSTRAASEAEAIRAAVQRWLDATMAGDADTVIGMVTDDVVFLRAGHAPMRHDEFVRGQRAQAGTPMTAHAEVEEVIVLGEWAIVRNRLRVTMRGARRAGYTLTVMKKSDGAWRIARDANLLSEES